MDGTKIWQEYEKGRDFLERENLYSKCETCNNFINGEQWRGLKYGKEKPPQLNILLPMMKSSTSLVAQHVLNIQYTSLNFGKNRKLLLSVCERLNENRAKLWESLKMDKIIWDVLQDAYICGDSFLYFFDDEKKEEGRILCEIIDTTNIILGDEQQKDIQQQPYILITSRKSLNEVKNMARQFGVKEEDISSITPDADRETKESGQKVTLIAKLYKKNGIVHITRSVKNVIIQKETAINDLKTYPIVKYTWKSCKGSARGVGDVWDKIPNQISINKALFRLEQAVKSAAYPVKIYRQNAINQNQIAKLNQPGASIGLMGNADSPVANVIGYMQPGAISPYALTYWQELIRLTKELSGAGDNLENINPENASGAAIQAALQTKLLNVNMQVTAFKQFAEDIARVWFDMIVAYNPEGIVFHTDTENKNGEYSYTIPIELLKMLDIEIKVDAVPSGQTYSAIKDAQLKDMLDTGKISFEEYVGALSKDSTMPVDAFRKIAAKRKETVYEM